MSVLWHLRSGRKLTGGKLNRASKKRRQRGMHFLETVIGKRKAKIVKKRGGDIKEKLLAEEFVNVADPSTGKIKKARIVNVRESRSNPHYVRKNVLTKGEIIETDAGLAKITSRPGQHGVVNAVLIREKKS